ncbi:60S acidic ribosomal protein P1-2 [Wickerhamomyces ciferrii]|uniref:60S acidic ribosomal protein P1-2 n=1 Tax=Wickerhamomyces ciferrii (strain ATCC 14091 / BCRC 22168 / CBS 111 / JCM 3599 / NBRC 0793 / NRRL Y-1031 F-60-10) TaxID=1206466 RepID=K0KQI6_WICCF|nr:60S acidic ribosomal protein P1-2 [Wickerhamomyces ciferrii]CCH43523.1 60S acidic ribosomal protein P1-2 [Wickerhamomyces ciferrii]
MSVETSLSYAALILADSEIEISSEKLLALTSAAKVQVDQIWADLYAKALAAQDVKGLLTNISAGGAASGASAAAPAAAAGGEAAAEEEKKEEEAKEESDDDMGFGLFD